MGDTDNCSKPVNPTVGSAGYSSAEGPNTSSEGATSACEGTDPDRARSTGAEAASHAVEAEVPTTSEASASVRQDQDGGTNSPEEDAGDAAPRRSSTGNWQPSSEAEKVCM